MGEKASKGQGSKIEIEENNQVFSKDAELFPDGCFMTYFGSIPYYSFADIKLTSDVLDEFLGSDDWEIISRKTFFDNDTNKYIYRTLNSEGEIYVDEETLNKMTSVFLLKNDEVGVIRFDKEEMSSGEDLLFVKKLNAGADVKIDENNQNKEDEGDFIMTDLSFFEGEKSREILSYLFNNHFGYKEEETKAQTNIITQNPDGMYSLKEFQIPYQDIDFDKHYNDGLREFHESVLMENIDNKKDQSFFILHGDPGTGKTSYIRYLIAQLGKKHTVIYLPPTMIDALSDPSFINFMSNNSGSVLVIEDAEEVVQKSIEGRDSAVNNLLNLTDGILGNCFNLDIICTFNAEIDDIDDALKRKGRLDGMWQFLPLEKEKVQVLCKEVGIEVPENKNNWTLGYIMNHNKQDFEYKKKNGSIGF